MLRTTALAAAALLVVGADARATGSLLSDRAYCEKAVREAALESLPRNARADYVRAPRSVDI